MNRFGSLALATTFVLVGCAGHAPHSDGGITPAPVVAIEVTNHNWMDVVVYAVGPTGWMRLGSVSTGSAERFELRPGVTLAGEFYLAARPVGSNEMIRSQTMTVAPGARVIWAVDNQTELTTYHTVARA